MGRIAEMLAQEAKAIENHPQCAKKKPKDVMIIIRFEGDHVHCVLPKLPVAEIMYEHLGEQLKGERRIIRPKKGPFDGI